MATERTERAPLLVDVPTAAQTLGIGRTRAWDMAQRGSLPGVIRIGRSVRVNVRRLEEWVDANAADGHPA